MPEPTAQERLEKFLRAKRTGAAVIDRRGRVEYRSLAEMERIQRELEEEAAEEADPTRVKTRRVVIMPVSGF